MTWVLILFIHAGVLSEKDSNSMTTTVFATEQHCEAAGKAAAKMVQLTTKEEIIKFMEENFQSKFR